MDSQILGFLEKNVGKCPLLEHLRGHEISYAGSQQISYTKLVKTSKLERDKVFTSKIVPYLVSVLDEKGIKHTNKEMEEIALLFKVYFETKNIYMTSNVLSTYLPSNQKQGGSLGSSCMNSANMVGRMRFYQDNGVKSICILKDEKIVARALFWENVNLYSKGFEYIGSFDYVDRIYCNDDTDAVLIREFAYDKGWLCHKPSGSGHGSGQPSHKEYGENLIVTYRLPNLKKTRIPYIDTMKYIDPISGICSNSIELMSNITGKYEFLNCQNGTGGTPSVSTYNPNLCNSFISSIKADKEDIRVDNPKFDIIE